MARCPSGAPPAPRALRRGGGRRLPGGEARRPAGRWAPVHRDRSGPGDAGRYAGRGRWRGRAAGRPRSAARRRSAHPRSGPGRGRRVLRRPAPDRVPGRWRVDRRACRRPAAGHGRARWAPGRDDVPAGQRPDGAAAASRPDARQLRRRPGDGPAQRRRPDDGRTGRLRSVGREELPRRADGLGRRARRPPGEAPAGRSGRPHPGDRWVAAVVRQREPRAPPARRVAAAAPGRRGQRRVAGPPGGGPAVGSRPARGRRPVDGRRHRPSHSAAGPAAPRAPAGLRAHRPAWPAYAGWVVRVARRGLPAACPRGVGSALPLRRPGPARCVAAWPSAGRRSSRTPRRRPAPPARPPLPDRDPNGGSWRGDRAPRPGPRPGGPHHAISLLTLSCGVGAAVLHRAGGARAGCRSADLAV